MHRTFVFTDLVGSTALLSRIGDARFADLVDHHDELLLDGLRLHRGELIRTQGDGTVVAFADPGDAVAWLRTTVAAMRATMAVEVRAGAHVGSAVVRRADYAGLAVHVAARLADMARPGEVLVSTDLATAAGLCDRGAVRRRLRGVPGAIGTCRYVLTDGGLIPSAETEHGEPGRDQGITVLMPLLDLGPRLGRVQPPTQVAV